MLTSIAAVALLLLLAGWAPKTKPVRIHSIGIIAAVGDTCMFTHVTDRPFQWIGPPQAGFLEISDWGIDDDITAGTTRLLVPRYTVQPIMIEHQDFDTWTYDSLSRHVRELPVPEIPVDAYLLVLRDWRADTIGGSDHQLAGLGVYRRDFGHGRARYGVFASYRLVLMDPDRGNVIVSRAALLPDGRLPWLAATGKSWPRTQNDLSDAQRDMLRADFVKLIAKSLPVTLARMGLAAK